MRKLLPIAALFPLLQACSGLGAFTSENIDRIRVAMPSTEVREIFGAPNTVRRTTCGTKTDKPWTCEVWKYNRYGRDYDTNDFYFSINPFDNDIKLLNSWSVSR